MDEPTAALDPALEATVSGMFTSALRDRTTILITHRMSLVGAADVVVAVDGGRIVESGTPQELLVRDSFLSRQFQLARVSVREGM
jgi:ABC-type multidrug transport system fused ATPase/permease subunit